MTTNQVKVALYKEKPIAIRSRFTGAQCDIYVYSCQLSNSKTIFFEVPRSEMGENIFDEKMPAQLLIRWLVN